jgi:hypothetical protein
MERTQKTNLTNATVESQAETLNDLPVAGEHADEAKGGAGSSASINAVLCDGSVRVVR